MTPFSPAALVVMLVTFYPDVSAAALVRARLERPEYFAGGVLGGSHGDKMTLPDSSGWDLIYDVENATGNRHWQCIPAGGDATAGDPTFALEPGPLVPIDLVQWPEPAPLPTFAPLVGDALREIGASDAVLAAAAATVAEASSPALFDAAVSGELGDGDRARVDVQAALAGAIPDRELALTSGAEGQIGGGEGDAEFTPPAYVAPANPGSAPDQDHPAPGDPYTDPETGVDKRR